MSTPIPYVQGPQQQPPYCGAGPPHPPPATPPRRTPLFVAVAAVAASLGVALAVGAYLLGSHNASAPSTGATPARATSAVPAPPSAAHVLLDERSACGALVPLLQDGTDLALAAIDRKPVDRGKLSATIAGLDRLAEVVPTTMRSDVLTQANALKNMEAVLDGAPNRTLSFEAFRDSGTRLATSCLKYARN